MESFRLVRLVSISAALAVVVLAGCRGNQRITRQQGAAGTQMRMVSSERIEWRAGPEALPPGAQMAVLEGDPTQPGPFTLRLRLPAGYRIAPHTHPRVERVTVLSGTARLGMGPRFDEASLRSLPAGSFFTMPPGMQHFAATDEETVIQLNCEGPWGITYVNPDDDPRRTRQGQQ